MPGICTRTSPSRRASRLALLVGLLLTAAATLFSAPESPEPGDGSPVLRVTLHGDMINPVVARYIERGVRRAGTAGAACLILQLDTPGGMVDSTKQIVNAIIGARAPVVVYVAPEGAWAGSAGVFITTAAHIAAMAPATSIGSAHPVQMGGAPGQAGESGDSENSKILSKKLENFTASWVRGLAQKRNRNVEWAEKSVRESIAATADEALAANVIDLIAKDTEELLAEIDGRTVKLLAGPATLQTKGSAVQDLPMLWHEVFLNRIAQPSLAYVLFMIALYGLIHEVTNPGGIWPGVIGATCLILALLSFSALPINWAGAALILLGVGMMVADLKVPSHGALTVGGVVAFVLGSSMLIDAPIPQLQVPWPVIIAMAGASVAFFVFAISYGIKAQRRKVDTGVEGMVGLKGRAKSDLAPEGTVFVRGEFWNSRAAEAPIARDEKVRVVAVDGMELVVEGLTAE